MIPFEGWYKHKDWGQGLRQQYWHLRSLRSFDSAKRRQSYRKIRSERLRLMEMGFNGEHLRLYCRYLSDTSNEQACRRLYAFEGMLDHVRGISSSSANYFRRFAFLVPQEHFELARWHVAACSE